MATTALWRPYVPQLIIDWQRTRPRQPFWLASGTLVSADISGFTRLSERLAARGRRGAEELTDLLNECFDPMIAATTRYDGDVVKFGGDALLVFFAGQDHAQRASLAAFEMRATISRRLVAPSAGTIQLSMSVGMNSGVFSFYLVDVGHRELIVTGPAATVTVDCESEARAGQILVSHATAELLPKAWLGARHSLGRILRRPAAAIGPDGTGSEQIVEPVTDDELDLTAFVDPAQQEIIHAGAEGEHRPVTIAFVGFSGIDQLSEEAGPPEVSERLRALAHAVKNAVDTHGIHLLSTDIYRDGGKLILTAGAPSSSGDDEERMLRAVRTVLDAGAQLPLRAGVNAGPVFVGNLGSRTRRTYTAMGDAVNLAARLMQRAVPGQLVATQTTVERAEAQFAIDGLEPFFVKGKAHPIQAAVVGPLVGRRQPGLVRSGDLPLVGRTDELATLLGALTQAEEGAGGVIEVRGETGIGKSRLLAELGGQSFAFRVLTGSGNPYAVTMPCGAMRPLLMAALDLPEVDEAELGDLLTKWVATEAPDLRAWLPFLALPIGALVPATREADEVAVAFRPARVVQATVQLLERALPSPTLILIEDVHWLDDRSLALLEAIATAAKDRPWLIVATRTISTDDEDGQVAPLTPTTEILHVRPLEADQAANLASLAQSTGVHGGSARQRATALKLAERAGGNPLFILELAQSAGGDDDELPDSVERLVTSRIDTLPAAARAWLRDAAVIGQSFELSLLTAARGDAHDGYVPPWPALSGFIDPDGQGSYRFRHGMLHRVSYEGLSYRRRREMHGRAGDAIVARAGGNVEGAAGILSLHYWRAQRHDQAWRFSVMAGKQAGDTYANTEAAEYLRRALDSSAHLTDVSRDEKARVAEALGDVCEMTARYDAAAGAYAEARRLAAEPAWQIRLIRKEGVLRERRGRYRDALRWYGRGLGAAERPSPEGSEDEAVQLWLAYAGVRFRQGRIREVAPLARRAAEAAERLGDRRALAHAFYLLDIAYTALGRPERHEYRGRALPVFEEIGDLIGQANVLNNLGIAAYYEGRWDESLDLYRRSQDARVRCGDVVGAAVQANNIAEILSDQGLLDEAEPLFRDALASFADAGYQLGVASVTGNLGRVAARAGRFDEGLALLAEALERLESMAAASFVLETRIRRVECLVLAGRWAEALTEADEAQAHGGPSDDLSAASLARLRARALLGCGQTAEAGESVSTAVTGARAADAPFELALALRARAAIALAADPSADGREADEREADELLARLGVVSVPQVPPLGSASA